MLGASLSRFTLFQPGLDYKVVQTGFTLSVQPITKFQLISYNNSNSILQSEIVTSQAKWLGQLWAKMEVIGWTTPLLSTTPCSPTHQQWQLNLVITHQSTLAVMPSSDYNWPSQPLAWLCFYFRLQYNIIIIVFQWKLWNRLNMKGKTSLN